jgi:hypothetical protein
MVCVTARSSGIAGATGAPEVAGVEETTLLAEPPGTLAQPDASSAKNKKENRMFMSKISTVFGHQLRAKSSGHQ